MKVKHDNAHRESLILRLYASHDMNLCPFNIGHIYVHIINYQI